MGRGYTTDTLARAKTLRSADTPAETRLWAFIVDFFCAEIGLVVELDGSSHAEQQDYDERRTR